LLSKKNSILKHSIDITCIIFPIKKNKQFKTIINKYEKNNIKLLNSQNSFSFNKIYLRLMKSFDAFITKNERIIECGAINPKY